MDSNCVNNYLGHALWAKRWHGLHIHVCQKRQTGETCRSHRAQLIRGLYKDPAPQVSGMRKRFRRVIMAGTETYISRCSNTSRHHSACGKESITLPKRTHRGGQVRLKVWLLPPTLSAGGEEGGNQDRKCLCFYWITVEATDFSSLVESQEKRAWQES